HVALPISMELDSAGVSVLPSPDSVSVFPEDVKPELPESEEPDRLEPPPVIPLPVFVLPVSPVPLSVPALPELSAVDVSPFPDASVTMVAFIFVLFPAA